MKGGIQSESFALKLFRSIIKRSRVSLDVVNDRFDIFVKPSKNSFGKGVITFGDFKIILYTFAKHSPGFIEKLMERFVNLRGYDVWFFL